MDYFEDVNDAGQPVSGSGPAFWAGFEISSGVIIGIVVTVLFLALIVYIVGISKHPRAPHRSVSRSWQRFKRRWF